MEKLLIKNGKIWNGTKFVYGDILTNEKTVASVGTNIDEKAEFVFDADGKIVTAGLVDIHAHLRGLDNFGTNADMCCLPYGVTTVNNAGGDFGDERTVESFGVKTTVFAIADTVEGRFDLLSTEKRLKLYGDTVIGLKFYLDTTVNPECGITTLKEICDYAASHGLKVMVHVSNSPVPMAEIAAVLNKGDIITHAYHSGKNNIAENDYAAYKIAKRRGVIIDVGYAGYVHTDFELLKRSIEKNFRPDTISSDITHLSFNTRGGKYSLLMCMSIARNLGMSESEVLKCCTANAAAALGKTDGTGCLKEGVAADIAVLDWANEPYCLTDRNGNTVKNAKAYRCLLTVSDGQVMFRY